MGSASPSVACQLRPVFLIAHVQNELDNYSLTLQILPPTDNVHGLIRCVSGSDHPNVRQPSTGVVEPPLAMPLVASSHDTCHIVRTVSRLIALSENNQIKYSKLNFNSERASDPHRLLAAFSISNLRPAPRVH